LFYIEKFYIDPIKAKLSFETVRNTQISKNSGTGALILSYIGLLTDLEDAPLLLPGIFLPHLFHTKDLLTKLQQHYTSALLKHLHWLIGSADFLGNPVRLFNNVGTGFVDFIMEPVRGIMISPQDFEFGLKKGTTSLVSNTVGGVFGSAAKLAGTLAKVGVSLSLDNEYQRSRDLAQQKKAKTTREGVTMGFKEIQSGLYDGVTGIVTAPTKGWQEGTAMGMARGVSSGITGAVIKPMVGFISFFTRVAEGITNTASVMLSGERKRLRYPRFFGPDRVLSVYNPKKAFGHSLLQYVDGGFFAKNTYKYHTALTNNSYFFITDQYLLCTEDLLGRTEWFCLWKIPLSYEITAEKLSSGEISIRTRETEQVIKPKGASACYTTWRKIQKHVCHKYISKLDDQHDNLTYLDALIIGGGWDSLGCAAALKRAGDVSFLIIEKEKGSHYLWGLFHDTVAYNEPRTWLWNTPPRLIQKYSSSKLSRPEYLNYIAEYKAYYELTASTFKDIDVQKITPINNTLAKKKEAPNDNSNNTTNSLKEEQIAEEEDYNWEVQTSMGTYRTRTLAMGASGLYSSWCPNYFGQEKFTGEILHALSFNGGEEFKEKRVLVVGNSNMAMEIISDLREHNCKVSLLVTSTPTYTMKATTARRANKWVQSDPIEQLEYTKYDEQFWKNVASVDKYTPYLVLNNNTFPQPALSPLLFTHTSMKIPTITKAGKIPKEKDVTLLHSKIVEFREKEVILQDGSICTVDAVIFSESGVQDAKPNLEKEFLTRTLPPLSPVERYRGLVPDTDGRTRALKSRALFILGLDMGYLGPPSLGLYAWYCGEQMAKELGFIETGQLEIELTNWKMSKLSRRVIYWLKTLSWVSAICLCAAFYLMPNLFPWTLLESFFPSFSSWLSSISTKILPTKMLTNSLFTN